MTRAFYTDGASLAVRLACADGGIYFTEPHSHLGQIFPERVHDYGGELPKLSSAGRSRSHNGAHSAITIRR